MVTIRSAPSARACLEAGHVGCAEAQLAGAVDDPDLRVAGGEVVCNGAGAVGRVVVHHDDLNVDGKLQ